MILKTGKMDHLTFLIPPQEHFRSPRISAQLIWLKSAGPCGEAWGKINSMDFW